jgi:hypothetical protein
MTPKKSLPKDFHSRLLVRFTGSEDDPFVLEIEDLLPRIAQFAKYFFGVLTQERRCPTDNS